MHAFCLIPIISHCWGYRAQQNQRDSPLLRLPAEIRNIIFAYALGGHVFDTLRIIAHHYGTAVAKEQKLSPLLAVCRQIYSETALLLYSLNTFSATRAVYVNEWVNRLGPSRLQAVSKIQFITTVTVLPAATSQNDWILCPCTNSSGFALSEQLLSSKVCTQGNVQLVIITEFHPTTTEDYRAVVTQEARDCMVKLFEDNNKGLKFTVELTDLPWLWDESEEEDEEEEEGDDDDDE